MTDPIMRSSTITKPEITETSEKEKGLPKSYETWTDVDLNQSDTENCDFVTESSSANDGIFCDIKTPILELSDDPDELKTPEKSHSDEKLQNVTTI